MFKFIQTAVVSLSIFNPNEEKIPMTTCGRVGDIWHFGAGQLPSNASLKITLAANFMGDVAVHRNRSIWGFLSQLTTTTLPIKSIVQLEIDEWS